MSSIEYEKQAQEYYAKAPVIVLGSGASAAHGISGMGELANRLVADIQTTDLSNSEFADWQEFCDLLKADVDLENALHRVALSDNLTSRIIGVTRQIIQEDDEQVFRRSLQEKDMFPLSRLLNHMFRTSLKTLSIVTTNYDRLAEYACDHGRIHHDTGFSHGYFRTQEAQSEVKQARKANIWKVHGSLDWFQSPFNDVIAIPGARETPDQHVPQIVTPGAQKYEKTHLEPYRTIIQKADVAIEGAQSYLCIGYGFNDDHIQPKLMAKCQRHNTPITIITYELSESARTLIRQGGAGQYLAIERGNTDNHSVVYSSLANGEPCEIEGNIWSLQGFLSLIM